MSRLSLGTRCLTLTSMRIRKDVSLTFRLPQALKDAMERVAEGEHRTVSQMVSLVLMQFLESRHEWPPTEPKRTPAKRAPARRR